ncbi:C4-dicarboxylate TRAP transporter large permease protein DctM [subsurface metagenome]
MDPIFIGIITILVLLLLLAIGVHISTALLGTAFLGMVVTIGIKPAISYLGQSMYYTIASPGFAALPLFMLMGAFAAKGGFAYKAYRCIYVFASKLPGSLAVATSYGCAIFGAICGSSLATAAIFGKIALPPMIKYKYDKTFALATIASSGTFAAMIPPSYGLVLYAMLTDTSVGRLFLAGIIPGLITATVYSLSIIYRAKKNPKLAPRVIDENFSFQDKIIAVKDTWGIALLIIIVLGGIYSGFFTPTEAAAVGALAALIIGSIQMQKINLVYIKEPIRDSARSSAMVFVIIIGALFLTRFFALSQFTDRLIFVLQSWDMPREAILLGLFVLWFFFGMLIEGTGLKALLLPIAFPIIVKLGYDPIWFGIITLKLGEIAAVTPPVGLNVYALKGVAGEGTSLEDIFKGIWPFVLCDIFVLFFLVAYPNICLFLPNLIMGR